jgi:alkanesulfonate monooxygenase SsuD/methylene tetrahydromethanopterin reductase-like flavin-dependent oxidoreductase (luciferase family)
LPPPSEEWSHDPAEPADPLQRTRVSFVGSAETVHGQIRDFVARTGADELIIVSHIYDHAARLRSYEIAAGVL